MVVPFPSGSEQLLNLFREFPFSTFLMKQQKEHHEKVTRQRSVPPDPRYQQAMHNIAEGAAFLLLDFPEWNLKFQTMMVQDFGAAEDILKSIRPHLGDLSGDDHDAEDFEITSSPESKGSDISRKWASRQSESRQASAGGAEHSSSSMSPEAARPSRGFQKSKRAK